MDKQRLELRISKEIGKRCNEGVCVFKEYYSEQNRKQEV
jgi:hypothetical protein